MKMVFLKYFKNCTKTIANLFKILLHVIYLYTENTDQQQFAVFDLIGPLTDKRHVFDSNYLC